MYVSAGISAEMVNHICRSEKVKTIIYFHNKIHWRSGHTTPNSVLLLLAHSAKSSAQQKLTQFQFMRGASEDEETPGMVPLELSTH